MVLAIEKKAAQKLQDERTLQKIVKLDEHLGIVFAGLTADARVLINKAMIEAQSYRLSVEDAPSVEYMARFIAGVQQRYTQKGGARPFGIAILLAGFDSDSRGSLWLTDPSGTYIRYSAKAIGSGSEGAQTSLQDEYHSSLTLAEATKLGLEILKQVMEEKLSSTNVEVATVTAAEGYRIHSKEEVEQVVQTLSD